MKQTAAVLGTTKQATNVTQTETVTRAGTMLGPLLVPLSREPRQEQPLRPGLRSKPLAADQRQQFQNNGHQVERSHSSKNIQLLILVLWVTSLMEAVCTKKL